LAGEVEDNPRFRKSILADAFHELPSPEMLEWLWSLSMQTPMWASLACREALLNEDLRPDLELVSCPALIVHGRHDRHVPISSAEAVYRAVADSSIVPFESSGHAPHLEEADRFERVVDRFLEQLPVDSAQPYRWQQPKATSE
jgi:pimeloyl-ACP methyl ester carboxylesterase